MRSEVALWVGAVTSALFLFFGAAWLGDLANLLWFNLLFFWLFFA